MARARRPQNNTSDSIDSLIARLTALETRKPGFFAYFSNSSNSVTGVNVLPFNATAKNDLNCFNTTTSTFTAPETGRYLFILGVTSASAQTLQAVYLERGGQRHRDMLEANTFAINTELHASVMLDLTAGEQIRVMLLSGTFNFEGGQQNFYSFFQGQLLERA